MGAIWFGILSIQLLYRDNANLADAVWGGFLTAIGPGAQSLTDGLGNTLNIVNVLGTGSSYAAELCYQSMNGGASTGTWYLPAICQLSGSGQGAGCASGLANIDSNLVQIGFGNLSGIFWSSTEYAVSPSTSAWNQNFGNSMQNADTKNSRLSVRCARELSY